MLTLLAPAKVNLTLEVIGRRSDGYHEIRSIMQTIDLMDTLSLEAEDKGVRFSCDDPRLPASDNLVLKAASLLKQGSGYAGGASLTLKKIIPVPSGLGGGSSDAAATLAGLSRLWGLGLSLDDLTSLASALGSDVPFFLHGGTALAEGRGEKVTPLPPLPSTWIVVLMPAVPALPNKTARLYSGLTSADFTPGQFTARARDKLLKKETIGQADTFNVFERVATEVFPSLKGFWQQFEDAGATGVRLAGSGPALFTLEPAKSGAEAIHNSLKKKGLECYLARARQIRGGEACP